MKNFITIEDNKFVAWDESQADIVGEFETLVEAIKSLQEYAETL